MQYSPVQSAPFSPGLVLKMRLWKLVQTTIFRWSPARLYGFRRFLLRCFGAQLSPKASIHYRARIDCPWNLSMGDLASVGEDSWIYALDRITIGDMACVGQRVQILTGTHDITDPQFRLVTRPVTIGPGAWVASSVIILPGVTIGEMSVAGAGAVVTKDVPPGMVVAGNPARIIKKRELAGAR